ncbi:sugar phosphate isomerase/epimerase family protein [Pedobacter sp. B4-66]|uniref:sugar phosphate isomerase/epimerase family protein n=1 Tax=Pedobacter sp. B4-66 TaxID=2817280 RepID=UPI001BDA2E9A|nr:sugar phosphate isomerase/epimerase family protein [Pedobacter sp. B4-66]
MNRRELLKLSAAGFSISTFGNLSELFAASKNVIKIGACDWSIGKANDVEAMELGKKIGLDGVQLSMGNAGNQMHLRQKAVQQNYKAAATKFNMQFSGLALGELNDVPYKSDPRAEEWVSDSIDVARDLGVKVVLLAFFSKGDLKNDAAGQKEVISRLKRVAQKAERAGIVLGIESWLSAEEHMRIIDAVGSKSIKVYYDVCNSEQMGYDIYKEIRWLGKQGQICEFHMKENGFLLGAGKVDFKKVRSAIEDIDYNGWIQIEGAVPANQPIFESYVKNLDYLHSIFPETK